MSPTTEGAPTCLRATDLTVRLGRRRVLDGLTFDAIGGQRLAIVGPNGSGKSTLLRACAGILEAQAGQLVLDGVPLAQIPRLRLAMRVGFMAQQADLQFPMSGIEAVLLGRSPHKRGLGLADAADLELARAALARLEVGHLAGRPVTSMSGGERQRLMLARVLVQEVDVLLLDEPTSAQDPHGVLLVGDVIAEEAAAGCAVVAAVHDLNLALRAFDRVLVLADGAALTVGAPAAVLAGTALQSAFGIGLRSVPDGDSFWVIPERPTERDGKRGGC